MQFTYLLSSLMFFHRQKKRKDPPRPIFQYYLHQKYIYTYNKESIHSEKLDTLLQSITKNTSVQYRRSILLRCPELNDTPVSERIFSGAATFVSRGFFSHPSRIHLITPLFLFRPILLSSTKQNKNKGNKRKSECKRRIKQNQNR